MSTYFGISSDAANTLFSSLNTSTSATSYLGDYASIKNGSYQKLLKSYYSKEDKAEPTTDKTAEQTSAAKKQLTLLKNDATDLYKAAKTLTESNPKDENASLKNVKAFVESYNSLMDSAEKSETKTVVRNTEAMTNTTDINSELLAKVGITVGSDNKMKLDEDAFKNADDGTVKTLFKGMNSYAADILSRTSNIFTSAVTEMNKSNSYDSKGSYSNVDTLGNLYNTLF